jgi:hypothetical protein
MVGNKATNDIIPHLSDNWLNENESILKILCCDVSFYL